MKFEASGQFTDITTRPASYHPKLVLDVSYEGNGESDVMPSFNIEASHQEEMSPRNENWTLENGQFRISNPQGDSIYGDYSGNWSESHPGTFGQWTLSVQGGTGEFDSARGALYASIETSSSSEDGVFDITGTISVPKESPVI